MEGLRACMYIYIAYKWNLILRPLYLQGAVQQLYSVQCADEAVDLQVLSAVQCQSIPAGDDVEDGTGCSQEVQSNLTQMLNDVVCTLQLPDDY